MSAITHFLQELNGTKPGECLGRCGKMIAEEDKDHALCNACWDKDFKQMPQVHVSFKDDDPEVLKKPPCQTSAPAVPPVPKLVRAIRRPHLPPNDPGRRQPSPREDVEEPKSSLHQFPVVSSATSEFSYFCPGCETGADGDDAHRSGHSGDGYHPECYVNAQDVSCLWCGTDCLYDYCSPSCYHAEERSAGMG